MQLFSTGKVYNFMGQRRLFAVVSVILVIGSIALLFIKGPRMGTDFRGGTEIEVAFKQGVDDEAIREAVQAAGFSQPDVISVTDAEQPHRFLIRVKEVSTIDEAQERQIEQALCYGEQVDPQRCPEALRATEVKVSPGGERITARFDGEPDLQEIGERIKQVPGLILRETENNPRLQDVRDGRVEILLKSRGDQLFDGLKTGLGPEVVPDSPLRIEWVGPKAGALLRDAAIKSILISLVFVMVYIAFRFDLRFAPGAVVSLAHDAVVTIGVLVLLERELTLTTVAALLTLVGYSVNDTVVVFDRVRENFGRLRGASFFKIINISLSEMLSRTVLTSATTILSMSAFFYWGTGALQDFAFTLVIGLILGTYSSIYVALPLTHWLDRRFFAKVAPKKGTRAVRPKKAEAVV